MLSNGDIGDLLLLPPPTTIRNNGKRERLLEKSLLSISTSMMPIKKIRVGLLFYFLFFSSLLSGVSSEPNPIMSFPSDDTTGSYSLFPDEDLRTGKRLRFDDDRLLDRDRIRTSIPQDYRTRDYFRDTRDRDRYSTSYPIMFEDRYHRPGDYSGRDRDRVEPFRNRDRGSRVYFEDEHDYNRNRYYQDDDRFPLPPNRDRDRGYNYNERPSLLQRPLSPFRPFDYDRDVLPGPSHSKLPVGATLGNIDGTSSRSRGRGNDVRIHVFDPASNSFGNPKKDSSFHKNDGPSPELFLNHEQYLEYHRKIALVRDQEFRKMKALGGNREEDSLPKRVLFTAKQPFDISTGLSPPHIDATTPSDSDSNKVQNNNHPPRKQSVPVEVAVYNGAIKSEEGERDDKNRPHQTNEGVSGGENNNDGVKGKKDVELGSAANDKSQITQIPPPSRSRPNFISKSGRRLAFEHIQKQIEKHNHEQRNNNNNATAGSNNHSVSRIREPLTSDGGFHEVLQAEGNRSDESKHKSDNNNEEKAKTSTTTTTTVKSTTSTRSPATTQAIIENIGGTTEGGPTALAVIEIPKEADGNFVVGPAKSSTPSKLLEHPSLGVVGEIVKKKNETSSDPSDSSQLPDGMKMKMTMTSSASLGVIAKVHAHVSHCPKLKSPAEIICDIHVRDSHGHPNPQLTVGWRRKFYNSTQPDILLVSNTTQVFEEEDEETTIPTTIQQGDDAHGAKIKESLVDFHDKFNVTLAPGISPMLRSVLLIRSVTGPDCGNYECTVSDGIYTLQSETLLFLCH